MTSVSIAFIVAMAGVTTTWLTMRMNARATAAAKAEDWRRQDEVAARVKEASEQAASAAALLVESNKLVAEKAAQTREDITGQLKIIHTLVNSQMTEAKQRELDATIRELASLREVMDLKRAAGIEPTAETLEMIRATEVSIRELRVNLADRARSQNETKFVPGHAAA